MKKIKKGFTLIELLVVVLIIGVLAAVALPQYRVAVAKAKVSRALPYLRTITDAQKRYYMQHGTYTADFDVLDIDIPYASRQYEDDGSWPYWGTPIGDMSVSSEAPCVFWSSPARLTVNFCPDKKVVCYGWTVLGDRVCKSFGGRKDSDTSSGGFPTYYMDF